MIIEIYIVNEMKALFCKQLNKKHHHKTPTQNTLSNRKKIMS